MASSSPASPFLLPCTSFASGNDEGDLLGRPRSSRYAASCLARMPPDEGWDDLAIRRRESVPREERNTHERRRVVAGSHGGLDGVDQDSPSSWLDDTGTTGRWQEDIRTNLRGRRCGLTEKRISMRLVDLSLSRVAAGR